MAHRELLERETAFTDLAIKAVAGEVSAQQLERQRRELMDLRQPARLLTILSKVDFQRLTRDAPVNFR